jgi:hypothetical protein
VTGASTYTWLPSGSGSTSTFTPSSTTIYTVSGSSGSCLSAPKTFTINVATTPSVGISASNSTICAGQSVTLTASGATTYAWLPGAQTTTVIVATPSVTSTYTVTGANGICSSTKTISVNVISSPTIATSITNTTICNGTAVVASATGATSYTWLPSGSGSSSTLTPSSTTIYTVTGSSGSCVSNTKTFTVNVNSNPTVIATSTNPTCPGSCNGIINATSSGGAAPYTYFVTGGSGSCSSIPCYSVCGNASNYIIIATDANGCQGTSMISVIDPPAILAVISNTNATCSSCADGVAYANVLAGSAPYTYMWMPSMQTTPIANGLVVGCYTVQITDNNGCSKSYTTCISFSTKVDELLTGTTISIYPNPSNGVFTISNTTVIDKLDITVTNALGQTVISESAKNTNQLQIDLSKMSKGVYYLKATSNEGNKLFKLILE